MGNPLKRLAKEAGRAVSSTVGFFTAGYVPNLMGGKGGAAAELAPTASVTDTTAGDNTAKYAADQEELARRGAAGFGSVADDGSDADVLGSSGPGVKRRAASRALLG